MERRYLPVRPVHLVSCAESILAHRLGSEVTLGRHWIARFLDRHPQVMKKQSHTIDQRRVMAKNPEYIMEFYILVSRFKCFSMLDATHITIAVSEMSKVQDSDT